MDRVAEFPTRVWVAAEERGRLVESLAAQKALYHHGHWIAEQMWPLLVTVRDHGPR